MKTYLMKYNSYIQNILLCFIGTFIYCIGVNIFIVPAKLYSGGFVGIAQLIIYFLPLESTGINLQGIIYFVLNIPLFLVGIKTLGKRFIYVSALIIVEESILLSLLPIPQELLIEDILTNCFIGGAIEGLGCGLTFVGFGSGGGTDLMGMIISKRSRTWTVGNVSLFVNVILYSLCAYLFTFETAVYSGITSLISSLIIDKIHLQNNNVTVNIVTKKALEVSNKIIAKLNRSATIFTGVGGFSKEKSNMIISIMSEYELNQCKKLIYDIDPDAFIFISKSTEVIGNFEKRLNE